MVVFLTALAAGGGRYWAARRSAESSPDAIWTQAEEDFRAGRHHRVESALKRLGRLREPTPLDRILRAQVAMARTQTDEALGELAQVPDEHRMGAQARLMAGQLELRRDRARAAEESFRAALRIDPALVQAHRELIYVYGVQLRRPELNAEFLALSKLTDLTFKNVFDWCMLRNNSWEPGEAIPLLARFVAGDPEDRWSRLALAENYLRVGLLDDAASAVAGLAEQDHQALVIRIRIALDAQDEPRARRLLALGRNDDPELARFRGRLALWRRDAPSAVREFRIAYAADPENRDTIYGLLNALVMCGEDEAAQPLRQEAGALDRLNALVQRAGTRQGRQDPTLLRQLGAASAALHRNPEARAWYKLAIARNPLDSEAQQALYRLDLADQAEPSAPRPGINRNRN
jgi:tetratricopeptide (TPR) repeat protein